MPSRALAIAISRALTRPSLSRRARRRSSSEPISLRIDKADIVGSPSPDHNICYSLTPLASTPLASQRQIRLVLHQWLTIGTCLKGRDLGLENRIDRVFQQYPPFAAIRRISSIAARSG